MKQKRQLGAAIVMALLVVALAATLAATALADIDQSLLNLEARQDYAQARLLARGGIDFARSVLAEDARLSAIDHLGEVWATPLPPLDAGVGRIAGGIEEKQGCFNVNNLVINGVVNTDALMAYQRLLEILQLPGQLAKEAVGLIAKPPVANGNPETTPLDAPGVPLSDFANLMALPGYDTAAMDRLRPYVCVLPSGSSTELNVNTASATLLAAAIDGMSLPDAERLVAERRIAPYKDIADFRSRGRLLSQQKSYLTLGVRSQYFLVHSVAQSGRALAQLTALLYRRATRWPDVMWQTLQ